MKKIGLFYKTDSSKTALVAQKIQQEFGKGIDIIHIEKAWKKEFESYDNIIAGTSTWFDGELPTYWDELIPELETLNLQIKKSLYSVWETRLTTPTTLSTVSAFSPKQWKKPEPQ